MTNSVSSNVSDVNLSVIPDLWAQLADDGDDPLAALTTPEVSTQFAMPVSAAETSIASSVATISDSPSVQSSEPESVATVVSKSSAIESSAIPASEVEAKSMIDVDTSEEAPDVTAFQADLDTEIESANTPQSIEPDENQPHRDDHGTNVRPN